MTIYDIAREAGVSASTVSRVLNHKSGVNPENEKKIRELLKKYNFVPNQTARGLVKQNSQLIGIMISDIRNVHFSDGGYLLEREFAKLGYCCLIFNTGSSVESDDEYIRMMSQRNVEAAVLIGSTYQNKVVEEAIVKYLPDTPIIIVNGYINLPNVYGVLADEKEGVADLVQFLINKGHTRLVYVNSNQTPSSILKQEGFTEGLYKAGIKEETIIYNTEATLEGGYKVTKKIMQEHPEIDGIVYNIDLLASGGGRALIDMGYSVPDQVAYTGIDNSIYVDISTPKITSLDNKLLELSELAVHMLQDILNGEGNVKKMYLSSNIVERETT